MDWNRVEGNWKQIKGKIKEQWGELTDDDLDQIAGNRDQLEGKIQERYGIEKDRADGTRLRPRAATFNSNIRKSTAGLPFLTRRGIYQSVPSGALKSSPV